MLRYVPQLDGIRALAVLAVLAFHARVPGFGGGYLGVDVFFVLSGFLITRILVDERDATGRIAIGAFYIRRLQRLYPALLLLLAVYLVAGPFVFDGTTNHLRDAAIAGLYLSDYGRAFWRVPVVLLHTWSLAVEEHFYLLWPPVLLGVLALPKRWHVPSLLLLALGATLWRWHIVLRVDTWAQPYYRFDTRLSGLLLGASFALWRPAIPAVLGFTGAAAVAAAFVFTEPRSLYGLMQWLMCAEGGAGLLVLSAQRLPFLAAPPLVWLGRLSYGVYLWHYPLMYWMRKHGFHWGETFSIGAAASIACAAVSYYTVETWFHARRLLRTPHAGVMGHTAAAGTCPAPANTVQ